MKEIIKICFKCGKICTEKMEEKEITPMSQIYVCNDCYKNWNKEEE